MDHEIARMVALLIPLVLTGGAALIGVRMWLAHKARLESSDTPARLDRLTDEMEALHHDVLTLRDAVVELHERVDFTERLLTRGETNGTFIRRDKTPV